MDRSLHQLFPRLRLPIDSLQGQESHCSQSKVRGRHAKEFSKRRGPEFPTNSNQVNYGRKRAGKSRFQSANDRHLEALELPGLAVAVQARAAVVTVPEAAPAALGEESPAR
jgi:hypothetical protein